MEEKSEMGPAREPRDLLPLTPAVLHVLLALADEERHGYGIMREVEVRTGGRTRLGPGTLYGSIALPKALVPYVGKERLEPAH